MNYILLHKSYGAVSISMTQDKMKEEVILLARKNSGDWQFRDKNDTWKSFEHSIMTLLKSPSSKIINWGNHIFSDDNLFDLNVPSAISNASNKARARRILQEIGVKVPRTFFWNGGPQEDMNFPIIARPPFHHGGKDFTVLKDFFELSGYCVDLVNTGKDYTQYYYAELFEKTTEFRVHVGHGKVLFIQEKPLVEGEIRANQAVNHESWRVLKWSEYHTGICQESIKAIEALGLDYGAVDIMYNSPDNSLAICEVNTSPSINTPYSSEKYAQYFDWVIRHNFPKHFEIDGKSVFYSEILRS